MNISCLIPSRLRPEGLRRCIESIIASVAHPELVEFILRVDEDDAQTIQYVRQWCNAGGQWLSRIQMNQGPRLGHSGQQQMNLELSLSANGKWLFYLNDDAEVCPYPNWTFKGWDEKLMEVAQEGFVVTPHCNIYRGVMHVWAQPAFRQHTAHFVIVPNRWWERFGLTEFGRGDVGLSDYGKSLFTEKGVPQQMDTFTLNYLCGAGFGGDGKGKGWKIATVPMTTIHHQPEDELYKTSGRKDHGDFS